MLLTSMYSSYGSETNKTFAQFRCGPISMRAGKKRSPSHRSCLSRPVLFFVTGFNATRPLNTYQCPLTIMPPL